MPRHTTIWRLCVVVAIITIYLCTNLEMLTEKSYSFGKGLNKPKTQLKSATGFTKTTNIRNNKSTNNNYRALNLQTALPLNFKTFKIPNKAFDPNSAFYGMLHKDTYILPLSDFGMTSFETIKPNWLQYIPNVMVSIKQYLLKNPSQNREFYTNGASTTITLKHKNSYKVGDLLIAHIQAKDHFGRNKTFGGDHFRARLVRKDINGTVVDGISCKIFDNLNGSYTLKVPLLISGRMTLEVGLMMSLERIHISKNHTGLGLIYEVILKSNETVDCHYDRDLLERSTKKTTCDYSNPRNKEPWFCVKPSKNCSPIASLIKHKDGGSTSYVVLRRTSQLNGSGLNVTVKNSNQIIKNYDYLKASFGENTFPSGYLRKGEWISFTTKRQKPSTKFFQECFEGKVVHMYGDSTIRQFIHMAAEKFHLKEIGPENLHLAQRPLLYRNAYPKSNITIYYKAHGLPLRNAGPSYTRPYISDSIDGIRIGGSDVYIFFNTGLHLIERPPSFNLNNLLGIKDAIIRHLKLFPETRFIVRGMNVIDDNHDYSLYVQDIFLRNVFKNIPNVIFLDFWDLTTVLPLGGHYHPKRDVMLKQAALMFSKLCDSD